MMAARCGPPSWASRGSCSRSYSQVSREKQAKRRNRPHYTVTQIKRNADHEPFSRICKKVLVDVRKCKHRGGIDMFSSKILTLPDKVDTYELSNLFHPRERQPAASKQQTFCVYITSGLDNGPSQALVQAMRPCPTPSLHPPLPTPPQPAC